MVREDLGDLVEEVSRERWQKKGAASKPKMGASSLETAKRHEDGGANGRKGMAEAQASKVVKRDSVSLARVKVSPWSSSSMRSGQHCRQKWSRQATLQRKESSVVDSDGGENDVLDVKAKGETRCGRVEHPLLALTTSSGHTHHGPLHLSMTIREDMPDGT